MEAELLKQINLKGIKSKLLSVDPNNANVLRFCEQSQRLIREFSRAKVKKKEGLIEYFLRELKKLFKGGEGPISRYISMLTLHGTHGELELYYQMFYNNIEQPAAALFLKFFAQIKGLQVNLYQRSNKLLCDFKVDIKRALELGARLLKDDFSVSNFSNELSKHFEARRGSHNVITADVLGFILLRSFQIGKNFSKREPAKKQGGVFLDWDESDPQMFQIKIERPIRDQPRKNFSKVKKMTSAKSLHETDITQVNYDLTRKQHQDSVKKETTSKPSMNRVLINICAKYVFDQAAVIPSMGAKPFSNLTSSSLNPYHAAKRPNKFASARNFNKVNTTLNPEASTEDESPDAALDQQVEFLNRKLEASRRQLEIQKEIWRLVLQEGQEAVRNYRELGSEIRKLEKINDVMLSIVDKNTQQWKELALVKNSGLENLGKFRFLLATLLEDCSMELGKDIGDFKFAGQESETILKPVNEGFDLYSYVTSRHRPDADDFDYQKSIRLKQNRLRNKMSEHIRETDADKKTSDHYDSLIRDLNDFPNQDVSQMTSNWFSSWCVS